MTSKVDGELAFKNAENVSRETMERLREYARLLVEWNASAGLVGTSTIGDLWYRHFLDSAQLLRFCPGGKASWLDLGSGGGFPGMVLAIVAADRYPLSRFTLVEANQRKCQFLKLVARRTGVFAEIKACRTESLEAQNADVVTARALAPMKKLVELAYPHLGRGGICLFPKGRNAEVEISEARTAWKFSVERHQGVVDASSSILLIRGLQRE